MGVVRISVNILRALFITILVVIFSLMITTPTENAAADYSALGNNPADTKLRIRYVQDLLSRGEYERAMEELKVGWDFDKKNVYLNGLLDKFPINLI